MIHRFTLALALVPLAACLATGDDISLGDLPQELTTAQCADIRPKLYPQSQSCPNPTGMSDNARKTKCREVKELGLKDFKDKFKRDPTCKGGVVFGPSGLIDPCVAKNPDICRLKAPNPPDATTPGWPTNPYWSECLNDWWVYCSFEQKETMGVEAGGEVCFAPGINIGDLEPDKVTSRELCQRRTGAGEFPAPCPNLCPTPTPSPSPSPSPTGSPAPSPSGTPSPSPSSTPSPTATATPSPTATATPSPTATATPSPTATATPSPMPTITPVPTTSPV
jgi:hypothetical protein